MTADFKHLSRRDRPSRTAPSKAARKPGRKASRGAVPTQRAPRARWRWQLPWRGIAWSLALLMLSVGAWQGARWLQPWLDRPLNQISIQGRLQHLETDQVMAILAPQWRAGFWQLDLPSIQAQLQAHPWIASASVSRRWPDQLWIRLREEQPIARWGEQAVLNSRGDVLPVGPVAALAALPELAGPEGRARAVMNQYQELALLLQPQELRVASLRQAGAGSWTLTLDNGLELALGRDQLLSKLRRFLTVYQTRLKGREADIVRVDLRYANGVAVAWRQGIDQQQQQQQQQQKQQEQQQLAQR